MTATPHGPEQSADSTARGAADSPTRPWTRRPSARWKIAAWITLTTLLGLFVVGVTARSLIMSDVDIRANDSIARESTEFRTFAANGVDPQTGEPFSSVHRMLDVFISRQTVAPGEVLVGVISDQVVTGPRTPEAEVLVNGGYMRQIATGTASSGVISSTPSGPLRWGRTDITGDGGVPGTLIVAVFTEQERAIVDRLILTVALVGLAGLLVTAGIAYLVAGRILAPVRSVRKVAEDIEERDLSRRVPVEGNDDISDLAVTFNRMLDRIEGAYNTQRQFVDDAGHELRTPITVVRGHLELLANDPADDPEDRARTLALVDSELVRMGRIVSDLLMLAKAERPDFIAARPVDVAALTLEIESKLSPLGDRRWLLMEVAEGNWPVDSERVTQAILQLAANAVQHTAPGSTIRLGSRYVGDYLSRALTFWISDEGPGVRPEDAQAIFERFGRGSPTGQGPTPRSGAGLGLSIVRAIAEGHGGTAWVRSVYGSGATFGIDLPSPATTVHHTNLGGIRP